MPRILNVQVPDNKRIAIGLSFSGLTVIFMVLSEGLLLRLIPLFEIYNNIWIFLDIFSF